MKVSSIAVIALVLLSAGLATAVITAINRNRELTAQLEQAQATQGQAAAPADAGRLRRLLEEQELANVALRNELAQLQREATNNTPPRAEPARASNPDQPGNPRRNPGGAWLDRLKQEDPERYKQIVQQREQRRKAADELFQDTMDQLDQRAQSAPTQTEAELAMQIADTLTKLNDLRQQWSALRALPEDERTAQVQQLQAQTRETERTLRDLTQQDRTMQLQNYARSLGVTDESGVQDFVAGITGIYSNTNYRTIVGGGGFGGGGRGWSPPSTGGQGGSLSGTPSPPNP